MQISPLRLNDLLRDVTGSNASDSKRSQHHALAAMLAERFGAGTISPKGVAKWFERGSVPGSWLLRIATVAKKKIDFSKYA